MKLRWKELGRGHRVLLLLAALGLAQIAWYYPQVPAQAVMQWDLAGNPGYDAPRIFFAAVLVFVLLLLSVVFWFFGYQTSLFREARLPNHKYWYSPDNFDRTIAIIGNCHQRVGNAFLAFWLVVNHRILTGNLPGHSAAGNYVGYALVAMLAYAVIEYSRTWFYFRKPR